jgi:hypothetical protein
MQHTVKLFKHSDITDGNEDRYGCILVGLIFTNGPIIRWKISDCRCCPSRDWINFLEAMKDIDDKKYADISGGFNSYWKLGIDTGGQDLSIFYEISESDGSSNFNLSVPIVDMIPVIEDIINVSKELEEWQANV